jgi:hypothetical protein
VTYSNGDLFKLIQSLAGVSSFATTETDDIANLINRRYFEAYQTIQMWPRYLVPSEERKLTIVNVSGATTYTVFNQQYNVIGQSTNGANVYQGITDNTVFLTLDGAVPSQGILDSWFFISGGTLTKDSDGFYEVVGGFSGVNSQGSAYASNPWDVTTWVTETNLLVTQVGFIPFTESGKDTIGEFIRIHRNRAFLNNSSREYDFFVDFNGGNILNISSTDTTGAFVTYKKVFTPFTTSSDYTTSTEAVPAEFFHYIAHAAYSDFLRMDGQHDKAQLEQDNAQQYLALELERVDVIMNQTTVNKRFSTHVNRQSR